MENMTPFDVVAFLFLVGWFILGYFQGLTRRIFGILALVFALVLAAQLRQQVGDYLAGEWRNAPPAYSDMIAFGALFLAIWIALSVGIQLFYRPAPLLPRYPVLDEILGGVLGVVEGVLLLVVLMLVTDPYFLSEAGRAAAPGEFGPARTLHGFLDDSLTASFLRHQLIPGIFLLIGGLFPHDVVDTFKSALARRLGPA
jgi:uncharacterized membrane protein required for colicin V production